MARPMLLINEQMLLRLHEQHEAGVPICKLIVKFNLNITPPTLTKLISYMSAMHTSKDASIINTIRESLFPEWLKLNNNPANVVVKQPGTYRYTGKFPLGKWELNEWA